MTVIRLDQVQLAMPKGHEGEAVDFYDGFLAIRQVPQPAHLASRGGCWFERGELKVHLGVEQDVRPATKAHPAFLVDDVSRSPSPFAGLGSGSSMMSRSNATTGSMPAARPETGSNCCNR